MHGQAWETSALLYVAFFAWQTAFLHDRQKGLYILGHASQACWSCQTSMTSLKTFQTQTFLHSIAGLREPCWNCSRRWSSWWWSWGRGRGRRMWIMHCKSIVLVLIAVIHYKSFYQGKTAWQIPFLMLSEFVMRFLLEVNDAFAFHMTLKMTMAEKKEIAKFQLKVQACLKSNVDLDFLEKQTRGDAEHDKDKDGTSTTSKFLAISVVDEEVWAFIEKIDLEKRKRRDFFKPVVSSHAGGAGKVEGSLSCRDAKPKPIDFIADFMQLCNAKV